MSSGFVTETELAEARKRRQEQWEKVRKPDQPNECPEEPYDGRSLYDRLQEQKMKKDLEYEETHKLKNLIRGLDDDEVHFLEFVDKSKMDAEKKQLQEEEKELKEFRNRVSHLQEQSVDQKILTEIKPSKTKTGAFGQRSSQKSLLGVGIKRKKDEIVSTAPTENRKQGSSDHLDKGSLKCVAILPGIGSYTESSDTERSSDSEIDHDVLDGYDLVGRKIKKKKQCQE